VVEPHVDFSLVERLELVDFLDTSLAEFAAASR